MSCLLSSCESPELHYSDNGDIQKACSILEELLVKVSFCVFYGLNNSIKKGMTMLRQHFENEGHLFDKSLVTLVLSLLNNYVA